MNVTLEFLREQNACSAGREYFGSAFGQAASLKRIKDVIIKTTDFQKLQWTNWLLVKLFSRKQNIQYAIFAVEQVLDLYEKKYPGNKAPREAINAAKKVLKRDTNKNREAAELAASASASWAAASWAASAASWAAESAESASAASAASWAAESAASWAARSAGWAAESAAESAAASVRFQLMFKIIIYGFSLLVK